MLKEKVETCPQVEMSSQTLRISTSRRICDMSETCSLYNLPFPEVDFWAASEVIKKRADKLLFG
jgi:hypothetical protein